MRPYEELDVRDTEQGELILRRRVTPDGACVHEVTIDGHFLMSSLVHDSERALATLGLERLRGDGPIDAIVGGLGLGYTAAAVLDDARIAQLSVIEAQPAVIDWFRRGLVPLAERLCDDTRCSLVDGDFFALATDPTAGAVDAILVDIDHSPRALLHPDHARFYTAAGMAGLRARIRPGGVFALWSADARDETVIALLRETFESVDAVAVGFYNPHIGEDDENTIYIAQRGDGSADPAG